MPESSIPVKLQRLGLFNVCLGQFMSAMDSRSVNVALPTLSLYFDVSMALVQWVPLAYQLTIVGLVLGMARLGDMLGRKKLYATGFLLLGLGATACGLSQDLWQMIAFRIVEAIGGAVILANGRAIASALYAREGRGRALGMMSMSFHLGFITGPSVGGFLLDAVGWRWIFFMNLPVAVAAGYMAWRVLPETVSEKQIYGIDLAGTTSLLLMVLALILSLQQVAKAGFGWISATGLLLVLLFGAMLYYAERRAPVPLLDLALFKIRLLTASILCHFFVALSHTATFFLLPFYLQGILDFTPTEVGITIVCFSLVIVVLAPVGGWLADRFGSRVLCTAGSALTVVSMLGFARMGADTGLVAVIAPLMLLGLGWALFQSPNLSGMFNAVESRHVGAVSGLSLTAANIANATGVALASVLFLRSLSFYGLAGVPPYTEWTREPTVFIKAFQISWLAIAALTALAVPVSALRGAEKRIKAKG
jgi:EmrB/QacA subfamily drug resistance transporter